MKVIVEDFAWGQHQELIGSVGIVTRWLMDMPMVKIGDKEYFVQAWTKVGTLDYKKGHTRSKFSSKLRFSVFNRDKFTCQYCGRKSPDVTLHIDHKIAVANGGSNDLDNLVTSCAECNLGKGTEWID